MGAATKLLLSMGPGRGMTPRLPGTGDCLGLKKSKHQKIKSFA